MPAQMPALPRRSYNQWRRIALLDDFIRSPLSYAQAKCLSFRHCRSEVSHAGSERLQDFRGPCTAVRWP